MHFLIHTLFHTLKDTWLMFPLLFLTYFLLESYSHSHKEEDQFFISLQKYGPILGALLGLIPQCGFSVLAAMLFVQKHITMGTLLAMFIATSDEAIPMLISMPDLHMHLIVLLALKLTIGIVVGLLVDNLLFKNQILLPFKEDEDLEIAHVHCSCSEHKGTILHNVLHHTLKIFGLVFVTAFLFSLIIHAIGHEALSTLLLTDSIFQPILASLFGLIPNCSASVVLCQLFSYGQLSFGSLLAGLITNAGLGLFVLFEMQAGRKHIFYILTILLSTAIVCGVLI